MNLLEIAVLVIIILFAFWGWHRGFIRKLASLLSIVLSVALVSAVLPYVSDFLKNSTPVYSYIEEQCRAAVEDAMMNSLSGEPGSSGSILESLGREQIGALMEQYGYDSSVLDTLTDAELETYAEQYLSDYLSGDAALPDLGSVDRSTQMEIIDNLPVPQVLRDLLMDYNNAEGYANLNASDFGDYIVAFISSAVMNVISFVAAVILVQVILWIAITALDILAHLPVIRIVNHAAGLALGLLQALFFLWLFFLILSMLQATEIGRQLLAMVEQSSMLTWLYEKNLFLNIVLQAAALFA